IYCTAFPTRRSSDLEMNSADYQRFEKEVTLSLGGQSAEVTTDIPDTIVLNNGKEVDEIFDNGEVNMIEKGSELQGVQKISWGEIDRKSTRLNSSHVS